LALLIFGTLVLMSCVKAAWAQGATYIRSDGSIDPPGAPITTADRVTYVLTGNITGSVVVERNNIVLKGAGYVMGGSAAEDGITLLGRSNVTVRDMVLEGFHNGIYLNASVGNTLYGNNLTGNEDGIGLDFFSNNNVLSANHVANNSKGVWLDYSFSNVLSGNEIETNGNGVELWFSSNNTLSRNNVTANKDEGIHIWNSTGNRISHNNVLNNALQVYNIGSNNTWDAGYPSGGNYWSESKGTDLYSGVYQNESGSDGICDTPYVIDANNTDRYPLMSPSSSTPSLPGDVNGDGKVSLIDLVILAQAYGSKPGDPNWNAAADIDGNGKVGLTDLVILALHYGQHNP
jgi:parallel beta-helix repeat protein